MSDVDVSRPQESLWFRGRHLGVCQWPRDRWWLSICQSAVNTLQRTTVLLAGRAGLEIYTNPAKDTYTAVLLCCPGAKKDPEKMKRPVWSSQSITQHLLDFRLWQRSSRPLLCGWYAVVWLSEDTERLT